MSHRKINGACSKSPEFDSKPRTNEWWELGASSFSEFRKGNHEKENKIGTRSDLLKSEELLCWVVNDWCGESQVGMMRGRRNNNGQRGGRWSGEYPRVWRGKLWFPFRLHLLPNPVKVNDERGIKYRSLFVLRPCAGCKQTKVDEEDHRFEIWVSSRRSEWDSEEDVSGD